jgi:cell division septation protein DedD
LEDFGLKSKGTTRKELLDVLNGFLLKTLAAGRKAVLIIDEAQHLSAECLEQVRLLSNLETDKEKLIQIILVGSEELPVKLELPELRHLHQRISLRYHLRPLDRQESRRYLQHRLNMARAAGSTSFEKGAYGEIFRFSRGVPRLINIVAERSLLAAYLGGSRKIKRAHVLEGRQSLSGRSASGRRTLFRSLQERWQRAPVSLILVIFGAAVVLVPATRETLQNYLQKGFTQKTFAPVNYSRHFVRAQIPQPRPAVMKNPVRREKNSNTRASTDDSQTRLSNKVEVERARGANDKARAANKVDSRPATEKFPQYLLKPPYVYTVQVESFKEAEVAATRMRELQRRGFDAWVAWIDLGEMGIWYRVLVGKYKEKNAAQAMAHKLSQQSEFQRARQIATHKETNSK